MLEMEHELRAIGNGQAEWIQQTVRVDYDNRSQRPLGFLSNGQYNKVTKLLGIFKGDLSPNDLTYLVKTVDGNTYHLYLHLSDSDPLHTPRLSDIKKGRSNSSAFLEIVDKYAPGWGGRFSRGSLP
jgi:hypothetical protein